ncbi:MAG TPA: hypothetical protein VIN07_12635 [Flavipsychrobacter sp.]
MSNTSTKVFNHLVELQRYFLADIEQLNQISEEAEKEENKRGYSFTTTVKEGPNAPYIFVVPWPPIPRCTIPRLLAIFSIIDYVGYLLKIANDNFLRTEENIEAFFQKSDEYNISSYPSNDQIILLNRCARQGVVHNYFAKLDLEICYHSSNPDNQLFFINNNTQGVALNVNELERITITMVDMLLADGDKSLFQHIESHHLNLETNYYAEIDVLIKNVKASL